MPQYQKRTATLFHGKEILMGAAGLDDVLSYVVDSTKVPENPASSGRYVLEAGTVMAKIVGSSKIQPVTHAAGGTGGSGAYVAADIVGIVEDDHEFWLTSDTTPNGNAADEPVGVLHHGCPFNTDNLEHLTRERR
jgi:hypothetical protein